MESRSTEPGYWRAKADAFATAALTAEDERLATRLAALAAACAATAARIDAAHRPPRRRLLLRRRWRIRWRRLIAARFRYRHLAEV
jgi:hypothetical protein